MTTWYVECWHSQDADFGHAYTFECVSAIEALDRLNDVLSEEGVNPKSVTYIEVSTSRTSAHTA